MDTKEALIVLRSIFFKCFFVGLFFLILATLVYMPCKCVVATIYQKGFGINPMVYENMWVSFVGLIKTILIFLFLTPALAIHWVAFEYSKKE